MGEETTFAALLDDPHTDPEAFLGWALVLARRARTTAERVELLRRTASSPVHQEVVAGVRQGVPALLQGLEAWRRRPDWRRQREARWAVFLLLRWAHLAERAADEDSQRDPAVLERELRELRRDGGAGARPRDERFLPLAVLSVLTGTVGLGLFLGLRLCLFAVPFGGLLARWLLDAVTRDGKLARAGALLESLGLPPTLAPAAGTADAALPGATGATLALPTAASLVTLAGFGTPK